MFKWQRLAFEECVLTSTVCILDTITINQRPAQSVYLHFILSTILPLAIHLLPAHD